MSGGLRDVNDPFIKYVLIFSNKKNCFVTNCWVSNESYYNGNNLPAAQSP